MKYSSEMRSRGGYVSGIVAAQIDQLRYIKRHIKRKERHTASITTYAHAMRQKVRPIDPRKIRAKKPIVALPMCRMGKANYAVIWAYLATWKGAITAGAIRGVFCMKYAQAYNALEALAASGKLTKKGHFYYV